LPQEDSDEEEEGPASVDEKLNREKGPILQNSGSAENFPDKFLILIFGHISTTKTTEINSSEYYEQLCWILKY
jgi:hypothetical protein